MAFTISAEAISAVATAIDSHEPFKLGGVFFQQARTATDPVEVESWTLLGTAFTGAFDTTDHRDPYSSPASSAVTPGNAPELKLVVPAITVAAIRARLADLIWLRTRDITMARLAVDSYFEAARDAEAGKDWIFSPRYAERGARLATQIKTTDHAVFEYLCHLAHAYQHGEARFVTIDAVRVLAELRLASVPELLPLLRNLASAQMAGGEYHAARLAFDLMVSLGRGANDRAFEREGHVGFARSYEVEAEQKARANAHGVAAGLYQFAIEAYQRAGSARAEIDRIRPLLSDAELNALSELKPIGTLGNGAHLAAQAVELVTGLPWPDALVAFACLHPICDYDELRQVTVNAAQHAPLMSMLARKTLEARGQTVARQPGMTLNEQDEKEQAVVGKMLEQLLLSRRFTVAQWMIAPALERINLEHDASLQALTDFVAYSAFVPPDRRSIFLRGIAAGFAYDFMTAVHFLVPQIENSLRTMLAVRGVPTTQFKEGIELELDLGALLYEKRLEEILPKGLIFELQCFLTERRAGNFRNKLAHGLFSDDAFSSSDAVYIWWLALHMVVAFHPAAVASDARPIETSRAAEETPSEPASQ